MLNPISQRKGWGRKSEKKEKEEMERKKKKKMKIKKRTKERKEGFPIKDWKKVKRKRSEENRVIPDQ